MDVVTSDFPMIIGLPDLRANGLLPDYIDMLMICKKDKWHHPLMDRHGHIFYNWPQTGANFSRKDLEKIHKHFHHATPDKLYQLLLRAEQDRVGASIVRTLQDIATRCAICQEYRSSPFRFRAALPPDEIAFNQELAMDLVWLEGDPVLHVIDTHTNFQTATYVTDKSADGL